MPAHDLPVRPGELVTLQLVISEKLVTASVSITDLTTDELVGCAVQQVGPFDQLWDVWTDLYERCPRQELLW